MASRLALTSHSPEETQRIGRALGRHAQPGDLLLLSGTLGTGKTCLAQGIAWGLGVEEYAHSPTYVLVHQYSGRLTMYHIDLYRIDDPREVVDLGIDDYLDSGALCVVEWAEKATQVFPPDHLRIHLEEVSEEGRRLTLVPQGERHRQLVTAVRREVT